MKILLKKIDNRFHQIQIIRADDSAESVILETKTFFLHDICHFVVESELAYTEGFWGMLAKGYKMEQLKGKTNELTEELRRIECVVGITQSFYLKNVNEEHLWYYLDSVGIDIKNKQYLANSIASIERIVNNWKYLPVGEALELEF